MEENTSQVAANRAKIQNLDSQYAELQKKLAEAGLDVVLDDRNEKLGYKLREARNERVNYIGIIGEKEAEEGTLTVRSSKVGEIGAMPVDEFVAKLVEEVETKAK